MQRFVLVAAPVYNKRLNTSQLYSRTFQVINLHKIPRAKLIESGGDKQKTKESQVQKVRTLYTQGGAAYVSARILVKASNLPVSKVRQFLHSKHSYTNLLLSNVNSRRGKHLPDSKTNFRVWT